MSLTQRWQSVMSDNYGTPAVTVVRGEGAVVWDADGKQYLDMVAGIAVNALGHAHPAVVEAVSQQVAAYGHTSNLAIHPRGVELAERLIALAGRPGRVFFCNSGAEANEAAFKVARLTGRHVVHAAEGSFHGRTMGALTLTGQPPKRAPFEPLVAGVEYFAFGDLPEPGPDAAAIIIEPIQGEAGVVPAPAGYLAELAALEPLLIVDEVQTGIGRTGAWFAHQAAGVAPDMLTLAKGLGGGLPIGALLTFGQTADLLRPGHHGSTFGGNPIACAAALAVLDTIESDGLLAHVTALGSRIRSILEAVPGVVNVRGEGLLLAAVLDQPDAKAVEATCRDHGVLVNAIGEHVIRLAPPLVLTEEQADRACEIIATAVSA
ncbi:MAG: acetylornithine transaminase [Micrococcales bacterium]|nr:acetylornithine transaminase [Micrococcales bacterium]